MYSSHPLTSAAILLQFLYFFEFRCTLNPKIINPTKHYTLNRTFLGPFPLVDFFSACAFFFSSSSSSSFFFESSAFFARAACNLQEFRQEFEAKVQTRVHDSLKVRAMYYRVQ